MGLVSFIRKHAGVGDPAGEGAQPPQLSLGIDWSMLVGVNRGINSVLGSSCHRQNSVFVTVRATDRRVNSASRRRFNHATTFSVVLRLASLGQLTIHNVIKTQIIITIIDHFDDELVESVNRKQCI